jgi:hypothetical protein
MLARERAQDRITLETGHRSYHVCNVAGVMDVRLGPQGYRQMLQTRSQFPLFAGLAVEMDQP